MKKILQFLLPPEQTIGIVLYFSFLCLILGIFSYAANYGMIYRHTSLAVSYISLAGIIIWFYKFQKEGKAYTHLWLLMLSVFTLHKWWIVVTILLEIFHRPYAVHEKSTAVTEHQRGVWQLLMILPFYLTMDVAREYSVWHTLTLNYFPEAAMLFILLYSIHRFRHQR